MFNQLYTITLLFPLLFCGHVFSTNFQVTNSADSGLGSLRQAIIDSNLDKAARNTITFNPGLGTITLTSGNLPPITHPVIINNSWVVVTVDGNSIGMTGAMANIGFQIEPSAGGLAPGTGTIIQSITLQNFKGDSANPRDIAFAIFINGSINNSVINNNIASITGGGNGMGLAYGIYEAQVHDTIMGVTGNFSHSQSYSAPASNSNCGW